jgi:predicted enzyme related to lactoylglutathione lyase
MINYRVDDIERLVEQLRQEGVTIVDDIQDYEGIGKFVHILDGEGNRIELWQPLEEHDE